MAKRNDDWQTPASDPLSRLPQTQLDAFLDRALALNDVPLIWKIVKEIERRGEVLEV